MEGIEQFLPLFHGDGPSLQHPHSSIGVSEPPALPCYGLPGSIPAPISLLCQPSLFLWKAALPSSLRDHQGLANQHVPLVWI